MPARIQLILALFIVAVALFAFPAVGEACPTCKDGMAEGGGPHSANMVQGYFYSILFMMAMPFLIVGGLSALFYWEIVKARRAQFEELVARDGRNSDAHNSDDGLLQPAPDPS